MFLAKTSNPVASTYAYPLQYDMENQMVALE